MARRKLPLMLLVIAAVLVPLVGASRTAADDGTTEEDTTAPVTTDDADGLWTNRDVTVRLKATDEGSGVTATYYRWGAEGEFTAGATVTKEALPDHTNDGEHTLFYYSADEAGNDEQTKECVVRIDTQAPNTTVQGDDASWHRTPVTLTFQAEDQPGLSGVARTEYRIGGGTWTAGTTATVKAPADHSWDGVHAVAYRSTDHAGNVETPRSISVRIDTTGPKYVAPAAVSVAQGRTATLRYRVNDSLSPTADVVLKVMTTRGKTVRTIDVGAKATNRTHSHRLVCDFSPNTYRYRVYARDLAGNTQTRVGVNRLTVKPRVLSSLSAGVSSARPARFSHVTVTAKAKDQTGRGLSGVKCVYRWRYKTVTRTETATTGSSGTAKSTRYIAGATSGYRVYVTVTATHKGVTKKATTSFVPR